MPGTGSAVVPYFWLLLSTSLLACGSTTTIATLPGIGEQCATLTIVQLVNSLLPAECKTAHENSHAKSFPNTCFRQDGRILADVIQWLLMQPCLTKELLLIFTVTEGR